MFGSRGVMTMKAVAAVLPRGTLAAMTSLLLSEEITLNEEGLNHTAVSVIANDPKVSVTEGVPLPNEKVSAEPGRMVLLYWSTTDSDVPLTWTWKVPSG
jgi:hypothetical protein